jgi:hypothetical protein
VQDDLASGRLQRAWAPAPDRVYVLVAAPTPWHEVVAVTAAIQRAGMAPAFVFVQPVTTKPPPPTRVDRELDALRGDDNASNKAVAISEMISKRVTRCPALIEAFGHTSAYDGANRALQLARSVAPALVACGCQVDIPELRSILFQVLFVPHPPRVIAFDASAPATPLALSAQTPWSEASQRLTAAIRNASFAVQ